MRRTKLLVCVVGSLVALSPVIRAAQHRRVDAVGDPLPTGAIARLGTTRLRHGNSVSEVAFSPDGRLIATASHDRHVCLWEANTGKRLRRQPFDGIFLRHVSFSPDGDRYIVLDGEGAVTICHTENGRRQFSFNAEAGSLSGARFSPDGQRILTTEDRGLRVWRLHEHGAERVMVSPGAYRDAIFAPDGTWIVAREERIFRRIDSATGEAVLAMRGHEKAIRSVDVSPDGKLIASAGEDGTFRLWDSATGRQLHRQDDAHGGREVTDVRFSPDGQVLATAGHDRSVRFWDASTGKQIRCFDGAFHRKVRFSPDGQRVAAFGGSDRGVRLLDAETGEPSPPLVGLRYPPRETVFLNDGKLLATASWNDDSLRVWDYRSGRQVRVCEEDLASAIAPITGTDWIVATGRNRLALFNVETGGCLPLADANPDEVTRYWWPAVSPDGKRMVTVERSKYLVDEDGRETYTVGQRLIAWQLPEGQQLASRKVEGSTWPLHFLADGNHVVGCTSTTRRTEDGQETTVQLLRWRFEDLTDERVLYEWTHDSEDKDDLQGLTLSPDTTMAALVRGHGRILIVGTKDGQVQHDWPLADSQNHRQVNFSANGKRIVAGPQPFHIRDAASGALLQSIETPGTCGVLSPNGQLLATGDQEGTVSLWDVSSGKRLTQLKGHELKVCRLLFTPDGKQLISSSSDCTMLVWSLDPHDWPRPTGDRVPSLAVLWESLGDWEAKTAYEAARKMMRTPQESVAWLDENIKEPVQLPAATAYESQEDLRLHRAAYVLDQIGSDAARQVRSRIRYPRPPRLPMYVAQDRVDALGDPLPEAATLRSGTRRYWLGGRDHAVAFSHDGKLLASIEKPHVLSDPFHDAGKMLVPIKIWETSTGQLLRTLAGVKRVPSRMWFTADAITLVCVWRDRVALLDAFTGGEKAAWDVRTALRAVDLSPDAKTLAACWDIGKLMLWDVETGEKRSESQFGRYTTRPSRCQFDDAGKQVLFVAGGANGTREVGVFDIASGEWTHRLRLGKTEHVSLARDGKRYAIAPHGKPIEIRQFSGEVVRTLENETLGLRRGLSRLQFLPDGERLLLINELDWGQVYDFSSSEHVAGIYLPVGPETRIEFWRNGRYLTVPQQRPLIYDLANGRNLVASILRQAPTMDRLVSADRRTVLAQGNGQTWICDPSTLLPVRTIPISAKIHSLSHDGRFGITGHRLDKQRVWELASCTAVSRLASKYTSSVFAFHEDGRRVVEATDWRGKVTVFDLLTGEMLGMWSNRRDVYRDPAIAQDGRTLVFTNTSRDSICVHDAVTGNVLWETGEERSSLHFATPQFLAGGRSMLLCTRPPNQCIICDARSGRLQKVLAFEKQARLSVLGVSPHGDFVVVKEDDAIAIVEFATESPVLTLEQADIQKAAFVPDGRRLITQDDAGMQTVWDMSAAATPSRDGETTNQQLSRLWLQLAGGAPDEAFAAMWTFVGAGSEAVAFLREKATTVVAEDEIRRLIEDLGDDRYRTREDATRRLVAVGPDVVPLVKQAVRKTDSLEVRHRGKRVLEQIESGPANLRRRRVAMILRQIDTPESVALMSKIDAPSSRTKSKGT